MKNMRWWLLPVVVGLVSSSAFAHRFGNPGMVAGRGETELGLTYDVGERELEADHGGGSENVDVRGLSFNGRYGLGNGLELRGRLIPSTVEWDDGHFRPNMLGLGAGVQWVPAKTKGPLTWGLGMGFDYGKGDDDGVDLDYLDIALNGGASYAVDKKLDVYGGLSWLQSDVTIGRPGGDADFKIHSPFGLFGGADYKLNQNWVLGAELRLVNETMLSLAAKYSF